MNVVEEVQTNFAGAGRPDTVKGIVPGVLIVGLTLQIIRLRLNP